MLTASSLNKRNGSETATGETPLLEGKPISSMVWMRVGSSNVRCFLGLKSLPTGDDILSAARYLAKDRFKESCVSFGEGLSLGELIIFENNVSGVLGWT